MLKIHVNRRLVAIAGAVGLLFIFATPVSASTSLPSIWGTYGPVLGVPYANQAWISDNSVMTSFVGIKSTNGATIPGGWSGGQASMYRNGALCGSAAMYYYPNATTSWAGGTIVKYCGPGNYTTKGSTAAYNGNGYNYYYTYTSPILSH